MKGTLNETSRICRIIHQKLGDSEVIKKFKGDFWYLEEQSTLKKLIIPFKQCKKTYFDILKYFSKNQSFQTDEKNLIFVEEEDKKHSIIVENKEYIERYFD